MVKIDAHQDYPEILLLLLAEWIATHPVPENPNDHVRELLRSAVMLTLVDIDVKAQAQVRELSDKARQVVIGAMAS
jgi:hypothetical protein